MEDIRLGRDLNGNVKQVPLLAATVTPLVSADPKRTRLIIGSDGVGVLRVAPTGTTLSATAGFVIPIESPILILRVEEWGQMVCWDWSGFSAVGGMIVTVGQGTLEKK